VTGADPSGRVPHVGFVLERSLGHITHAENLKRLLPAQTSIDPEILEIGWDVSGVSAKVPGFNSNWTVRSGVRARRALRSADRRRRLDALFVHTQVPAVLVPDWIRRRPTVVSIDATPLQYDELGEGYDHQTGSERAEHLKWRLNRVAFERADHIVAWTSWAKQGVVDGYGIDASKVTVIPPGVVSALWQRPAGQPRQADVVRVLFVGGDLDRKGGRPLVQAFETLRTEFAAKGASVQVELDLVTKTAIPATPGVTVHHGLTANSAELIALFHRADIFCLPTRADCLPMVLSEAGAAGLPLVSTAVAGIPEIVKQDETGLLVPPDDVGALVAALRTLVESPELRQRLGAGAQRLAVREFDAQTNVDRLVDVIGSTLRESAAQKAAPRRALVTVSGVIPDDVDQAVDEGRRPRPDYAALAEALDADLVDVAEARRRAGRPGRIVERVGGGAGLLAWVCFRERSRYRAILTDGEQVGLPLALLCRFGARRPFAHVMIVHILSVPKKAHPFRLLRLGRFIDTMVLYSSEQRRFVIDDLGFPGDRALLTSFAVDSQFFSPARVVAGAGRTVSTAGLEFRDYPTLIEAARKLDARVVIAAASPWSKRSDSTDGADLPDNVEVCRLGFEDLRQLYADSDLVVMPLLDVPFQAGVTTILEAMAMGKAVICSRTKGQTDVIVDGDNGIYVQPGDPEALRGAITGLLDDRPRSAAIGARAQRYAQEVADVRVYAQRLAGVVDEAARRHA
jgi:glycosyltransferase involved in cell wall biosynthesis